MDYPRYHKNIVKELLDGKFILSTDTKLFNDLKEHEAFYERFFSESFEYSLIMRQDFGYVISSESNESLSRDTSVFFALLCHELDKDGRNFLDQIQYSEFEYEEIDKYFENSSYADLIQSNNQLKNKESRRLFFNNLNRRNIIEKTSENRFMFTSAYKVFIDFATEFAKSKMNMASSMPTPNLN